MSILAFTRGLVVARDQARCTYCRRKSGSSRYDPDGHTWHIDHVLPLSLGGTDDIANLALACRRCNLSKHNRPAPKPHPATRQPRSKRANGRPRGSGAQTVRVIAAIPRGTGRHHCPPRLAIGRALYQQMGSPTRIDVIRDAHSRVRIRAGKRYSVCGMRHNTQPRISVGRGVLTELGLAPGYYPARVYRGGIVLSPTALTTIS